MTEANKTWRCYYSHSMSIYDTKREKKELLSIFKEMWQKSNSPLHRIYASWEDLVNHVEVEEDKTEDSEYVIHSCPYCKTTQQIKRSTRRLFPYQNCISCSK